MALKYFLLALWRLQLYTVQIDVFLIIGTIIMILSGHKSTHGANYKKLLLWEFLFIGVGAGNYAFGYSWAKNPNMYAALTVDMLTGISVLLFLLQFVMVGIFVFSMATNPKGMSNKKR